MKITTALVQSALPDSFLYGASFGEQGIAVSALHKNDERLDALSLDVHFSIDTRSINRGDLFVALQGEQVDGHNYLAQALKKGASAVIIEEHKKHLLDNAAFSLAVLIIVVRNSYHALDALAFAWRSIFTYPVVGVTGSLGKTTTKEMLRCIGKESGKNFLVSPDNQNTVIGLALTISHMTEHHDVAVFEMGIDGKGEMDELVRLARPTIAVVTSVSISHAEKIGSLEEIAIEKKKIFSLLRADQVGIIGGDYPLLNESIYKHPIIRFGHKKHNDLRVMRTRAFLDQKGMLKSLSSIMYLGQKYTLELPNNHRGFVVNALAATTVALQLGISFEKICAALSCYKTYSERFEPGVFKKYQGALINDAYNANPVSMKAALEAFGKLDSPYAKVAVLGDMRELGPRELFWHRSLGRYLKHVSGLEKVILVGALAKKMAETGPKNIFYQFASSWQEAQVLIEEELKEKPLFILFKSSKSVGLRDLVKNLATGSQL